MRKALIIGINNYDNAKNLNGCENDANAVKKILESHADDRLNFTVINPNFDVGTKVGLLDEVKELFNGNTETDIALFYFSGHGGFDSSRKEGYIITTNCTPTIGNVIHMNEILNIVNSSKIRNKVVILDCCYAGAMGNITESTAALKEGVTILAASKSDEVSLEIFGYGVFTSLLLEALRGGAADLTGHVTAGGIYAYIDKALGPCGQRPVFKTNTAQFLPLREAEPPIGRKILRKLSNYFLNPTDDYKLDPSFEFTNINGGIHRNQEPYALLANVAIFEDLKALNKVGLVVPNCEDLPPEERYMYFAAMESKSCKLTPIGKFYWQLAKDNKI